LRIFVGGRASPTKKPARPWGFRRRKQLFVPRAVELAARAFAKIFANLEQRIRPQIFSMDSKRDGPDHRRDAIFGSLDATTGAVFAYAGFSCSFGQGHFLLNVLS